MNKRKLSVVGTDVDELANIVGDVVNKKLQENEDKEIKKKQINKILKKDVMLDEKKQLDKKEKIVTEKKSEKHEHNCPSCQAALKSTGKNYEICEGCGDTVVTFKKNQKMLVCSDCGNVVSQSDPKCPNCGSTKAHYLN